MTHQFDGAEIARIKEGVDSVVAQLGMEIGVRRLVEQESRHNKKLISDRIQALEKRLDTFERLNEIGRWSGPNVDILHGLKQTQQDKENAETIKRQSTTMGREIFRLQFIVQQQEKIIDECRHSDPSDKLPITKEWLISVGFVINVLQSGRSHMVIAMGKLALYPNEEMCHWLVEYTERFELETRRDVRILCELLRIELKESVTSAGSPNAS